MSFPVVTVGSTMPRRYRFGRYRLGVTDWALPDLGVTYLKRTLFESRSEHRLTRFHAMPLLRHAEAPIHDA
jgi:hypothetical protein